MNTNVLSVKADSDQEETAHIFKKYGYLSLPVIDKDNRLTGIISANDILQVLDEETTEDIQKMSAYAPLDRKLQSAQALFELWSRR
ncbi:MAG: CBS domain-containing protein [Chromatiales bacterium]|nr:CBS domain-containing protein [Chromatiales bacterium]